MIHNYSDYIKLNEGKSSASHIFWNKQLKELINREWTEISTTRYSGDIYEIKFTAGHGQYDNYAVLVEDQSKNEKYYLEDNTSKDFQEKLKTEFWKAPQDYYKQLKYAPKCLGEIGHLAASDKYNM